ncbi:tRNA (adenosine(37)-N6)-threonylcarbamoyltransferase complex transferase subunit TsaD [Patescibacteria group bacterium]|nr:tRNA (adenosine(37)-N6)-threonylcarbamoyltransferase complex transferase subunit TsaD [Patescibacteria group bacterium]MBU1673459.1 tRNA (adenosine(37)-N6)-threonylcarbamoyltransferase complex transferase subunit TsaD [Patescibacteria group bacterium]MBU1962919.1 tRNA (adenosine(37)-N6)-threonylcarbamoyltransferase complex transferase subunit TsaD [Patescibacteria group bacterium]
MNVLGIETSCDETSAAIVSYKDNRFSVLSNIISSQIPIHQATGGVVPEVAAREHVKAILPVINAALWDSQTEWKDLDRIAVASGPGLITSLFVGTETAKTLSYLWKKPIYPVNHMEAHIAANFLSNKPIKYPALCLIVSGGHTEIVLMPQKGKYKLIGQTRDDAAGECFDKTAKIMGLPYPGGPEISKLAAKGKAAIDFPRPMLDSDNYDFSFSGLKTAVLYEEPNFKKYSKADIAKSIEDAIIDVLVDKTKRAAEEYKVKTVMLAGGVSANKSLREKFRKSFKNILIPGMEFTTDNAAMVAAAGAFTGKANNLFKVQADPNWEITPR